MGRLTALLLAALALLPIAGCSAGGASRIGGSRGGPVVLSAEEIPGLGEVLVDEGVTLYAFAPDRARRVTCVGDCASAWPPLTLSAGQRASATAPVKERLIGSDPGPGGSAVVTYAGWPLYSYVSDTEPGEANGQDVNLNGGYWYVISPSGKLIR